MNDKKSILDVRATINDNTQIDIEIQVARTMYMPERSLYYWAKMYCEQLNVSERYTALQKTICINIVDFEATEKKNYHSIYKIKEIEDNYLLTDLLEIHFLELTKLSSSKDDDKLYNWLKFIKGESREETTSMAMAHRDIDKALNEEIGNSTHVRSLSKFQEANIKFALSLISQSKEERAAYLSREMALHDEATRLHEAMEEGLEKGREEGRAEGKMEIVKNLLDILDDEIIALKTGLGIDEVKKLRNEMYDI